MQFKTATIIRHDFQPCWLVFMTVPQRGSIMGEERLKWGKEAGKKELKWNWHSRKMNWKDRSIESKDGIMWTQDAEEMQVPGIFKITKDDFWWRFMKTKYPFFNGMVSTVEIVDGWKKAKSVCSKELCPSYRHSLWIQPRNRSILQSTSELSSWEPGFHLNSQL